MKLIWKSDDGRSLVIRFTKKEIKKVKDVILTDNYFNDNFEFYDVSKPKSIDYLLIQKNNISIDDCIDYLKLCFANDVINSSIKSEKKKK